MFTQIQVGEKIVTPRVRLYEPFSLMKKLYNADFEIIKNTLTFRKDEELFALKARNMSPDEKSGLSLTLTLYAHNYLALYELDDDPAHFEGYEKSNYVDFKGVHAITCSTEVLADRIREYNPNVKVLKNQIASLLPEKKFEDKGYVTVFFGALNRQDCYDDILPVLNKLAKKYKDELRFMVISDFSFFKSLQTPHKAFAYDKSMGTNEFVPYRIYMNSLYNSDIALLPLKDTAFNRAKSDLKFIESGNAQVAVLASPTVYETVVKDGKTGFIYKSPKEFQTKLEILIKDKTKRIEMSKAAYRYVKQERLLIDSIEERYNWMREMYNSREKLHGNLLERYNMK